MKVTTQSVNGTSFHDTTISATPNELVALFGEPTHNTNDGQDKVNMEWELETTKGKPITIYDWKEYRVIDEDELIEWHIGGHSALDTEEAKKEIESLLTS
jgi:hypothetical protein